MRLTCPVCDARYEVEDSLIPPEGREVECANCGHQWHQPGPRPQPILLGDPAIAPEVTPFADPPRTAPRPSAAALDILREEARRELAQRAAETPVEDAAPSPPAIAAPDTPQPELIVAEPVDDDELPYPVGPLPDPERLGASLRWPDPAPPPPPAPQPRRDGYTAGFSLPLAAAVILTLAYVAAPALSDAGRVGAAFAEYRNSADAARSWLYDHAAPATDRAIAALRGLAK